jgi:hypothetical protein
MLGGKAHEGTLDGQMDVTQVAVEGWTSWMMQYWIDIDRPHSFLLKRLNFEGMDVREVLNV